MRDKILTITKQFSKTLGLVSVLSNSFVIFTSLSLIYLSNNDKIYQNDSISVQGGRSTWKPGKPGNVMKFRRTWKSHGFFWIVRDKI